MPPGKNAGRMQARSCQGSGARKNKGPGQPNPRGEPSGGKGCDLLPFLAHHGQMIACGLALHSGALAGGGWVQQLAGARLGMSSSVWVLMV